MGYGKIKSKHIFKKVNIQAQKNSEMIILLKHSHSRLLFWGAPKFHDEHFLHNSLTPNNTKITCKGHKKKRK